MNAGPWVKSASWGSMSVPNAIALRVGARARIARRSMRSWRRVPTARPPSICYPLACHTSRVLLVTPTTGRTDVTGGCVRAPH